MTNTHLSPRRIIREGSAECFLPEIGVDDLQSLVKVLTDLRTVIGRENTALRNGLPASLAEDTARKEALGKAFGLLMRRVLAQGGRELEQEQIRALHALGSEVRELSQENADRLQAALGATERRVEQVVAALRDRAAGPRLTYGGSDGNVRRLRARFVDYGADLRA